MLARNSRATEIHKPLSGEKFRYLANSALDGISDRSMHRLASTSVLVALECRAARVHSYRVPSFKPREWRLRGCRGSSQERRGYLNFDKLQLARPRKLLRV